MKKRSNVFSSAALTVSFLIIFGYDIQNCIEKMFQKEIVYTSEMKQSDNQKKQIFQNKVYPLYVKVSLEEKKQFNHPVQPLWENMLQQ